MQRERLFCLDLMRAWLCTAVMLVHVFGIVVPFYGTEQLWKSTFFALLSSGIRITVPGFVFLSGYLVLYRRREFDTVRFWRSRARSTLPLYVLFTGLYFTLHFRAEGLYGLIKHLIKGTAEYHLYFVPIIMQLYLITPLLVKAVRRKPQVALAAAALISYGFCMVNSLTFPLLTMYYWCLPYLLYYVWGIVAGCQTEQMWPKRKLLLVGLAFLATAALYEGATHLAAYAAFRPLPKPGYSFLLSALEFTKNILGIFSVRQVCLRLAPRLQDSALWERSISFASTVSFLVYLAHPLLLGLMNRFLNQTPWLLFIIFPPLMWLGMWIYSHCERLGKERWQRFRASKRGLPL